MALTTVRPQGMGFNTGRRNLIINGAMQVAQRGTSFATMGEGDSQYTLDRFRWQESGTPTFEMTVTQDSSSPDEMGNSKSLKVEVTTADATLGSNERARIEQYIEAQNCQGIRKGTSAAKKLTASFWVKSSKTGTYIVELQENDNDRSNSQSYTISSANTWEYKTVTFPADTTGAINNDNGNGITFRMYLCAGTLYTSGTLATSWQSVSTGDQAVGQVNLADTANATWFVTGIQLELGENASDFEHRSFGEELALCQRYYEKSLPQATAPANNTSLYSVQYTNVQSGYGTWHNYNFAVPKRAAPTMTAYNPSSTTANKAVHVADNSAFTNTILYAQGEYGFLSAIYGGSGDATGNKVGFNWDADAEL